VKTKFGLLKFSFHLRDTLNHQVRLAPFGVNVAHLNQNLYVCFAKAQLQLMILHHL
jgi:hypothetical protein